MLVDQGSGSAAELVKKMPMKDRARECEACGCSHHGGHHGCRYKIESVWIECDGCECWSCRLFRKVGLALNGDWL